MISKSQIPGSDHRQRPSVRITWPSGFVAEDIEPVKRTEVSILNRTGRVVLKAVSHGRPVKLYEAANEVHARFIQHLSTSPRISEFLPAVLDRNDRWIAAEWVPGLSVADLMKDQEGVNLLKRLAGIQALFHAIPVDSLPEPGFDYWRDYIRTRFLNACNLLGYATVAAKVCQEIDEARKRGPEVLMHPDLRTVNTVQTPEGRFKVIDNELLTVGGMRFVDVCNVVVDLSPDSAATYVQLYLEQSGRPYPAEDELRLVRHLWLARTVGSRMVSGQIQRAQAAIEKFKAGDEILPWLMNIT